MDTHWHQRVISSRIRLIGSSGRLLMRRRPTRRSKALLGGGFKPNHIDVLHGEKDLNRLDPTGAEHGFLARFQRTLIRTAGPAEEYRHLSHHLDDLCAGRFAIMVLAKERKKRHVAADILNSHGAEFVGFYGRWTWQSFEADPADSTDLGARDKKPSDKNRGRRIWRPIRQRSPPSMI